MANIAPTTGYVRIWRKVRAGWLPNCRAWQRCSWYEMITMAHRKPKTVHFNGSTLELQPGEFMATYTELAKQFGVSRKAMRNWVAFLERMNSLAIRKVSHSGRGGPGSFLVVTIIGWQDYQASDNGGGPHSDPHSARIMTRIPLITPSDDDENRDSKQRKLNKPAKTADPRVREVFEHWVKATGREGSARMTSTRRDKIKTRLQDSTMEEIKGAIDACANSPWHQGANPNGMRYDDLARNILASREKVEWWNNKPNDLFSHLRPKKEETEEEIDAYYADRLDYKLEDEE